MPILRPTILPYYGYRGVGRTTSCDCWLATKLPNGPIDWIARSSITGHPQCVVSDKERTRVGTNLSKVLLHIFNLLVLLVFTSYNNACRCVYVCVVHTNELYYISAVLECVFALFDFTFFFKYCPLTNVMRIVCKHLCTFRVCVWDLSTSQPPVGGPQQSWNIYMCVL